MKLSVIGTGSAGNSYILWGDETCILLEAGLPFSKVKKKLKFNTELCQGVFITHTHNDHAGSIKDFHDYGMDIYAPEEVFTLRGLKGHNLIPVKVSDTVVLNDFKIRVLPAYHDADTVSYLIKHKDKMTVFITDTYKIPYGLKNIDNYIIEANYDPEILERKVREKSLNETLKKRVELSHLSIYETLKTIKNDTGNPGSIILIHLSDGNSDKRKFKNLCESETGIPVVIAENGMDIEL